MSVTKDNNSKLDIVRDEKSIFHYNPESKKWGRWTLTSPEFEDIITLVRWNRDDKLDKIGKVNELC